VRQTERDQRFPERTVYELTDAGLHAGREWLIEMLGVPRNEFPWFPAALSFVFGLSPGEAQSVLQERAASLRERLAELEAGLNSPEAAEAPRVTLLDGDFLRSMTMAELSWVERVVADLRSGALSWSGEQLRAAASAYLAGERSGGGVAEDADGPVAPGR